MRRYAKSFLVVLLIILLSVSVVGAHADSTNRVTTNYIYSKNGIAGTWNQEPVYNLTSTQARVYGGDAGVWRYQSNVGLSDSFNHSDTRTMTYQVWEMDSGSSTHFRTYRATFAYENGLYFPNETTITYISGEEIEADSQLELFIKYYVMTDSKDTSKYIPDKFIMYKFWAY